MRQITIGYFNDKNNSYPELPIAFENTSNQEEKEKAINLLYEIDRNNTGRRLHYKGYSRCRICDCVNGSSELEIIVKSDKIKTKFIIPEGYKHYIEKHNVKPDMENLIKLQESLKLKTSS